MQKIAIKYATLKDLNWLKKNDDHIPLVVLKKKIQDRQIILTLVDSKPALPAGRPIGWLRFGFFWDIIPFMNMLALEENYRRQGLGKKMVLFWEKEMKKNKYKLTLTSTQTDEQSQYFYRKIGYHDIGVLSELNNGPAEIFLLKKL